MGYKGRILVVEDDLTQLSLVNTVLSADGYEVACANNIKSANQLVSISIIMKQPFNLAILDLHLGMDSGGEFGRRLLEIIGNINVVIMTGSAEAARLLTYRPDHVLIKVLSCDSLREVCAQLMKPKRHAIYSPEMSLNYWLATQHLRGIESLRWYSGKVDTSRRNENTEKITSLASVDGATYVNTVIYQNKKVDKGVVNIALSSCLGCLGLCEFCKNHRNRLDKNGKLINFIRPLSTDEIVAQAYIAMYSSRAEKAFEDDSDIRLVFNFAAEGDGLRYNLDNCARAIEQLSKITKPDTSFIMTSIGSESALREIIRKYINLLNLRQYWSVDSLFPEKRVLLKRGTAGDSLENLRDLYEIIANLTGKHVSVSWVLIKGFNDSPEDAAMIAKFFKGRPFDIKLMRLVPDSLKRSKAFENLAETTPDDIKRFRRYLEKLGLENVRERDIVGLLINAGCGNTIVEWLHND